MIANPAVGSEPEFSVYDPVNGYDYVEDSNAADVSVLSGTAVIQTIGVGTTPNSGVFDASNGFIYVTNGGSSTVSVLSGTTLYATITLPAGYTPNSATYDPVNEYVYVTESGNHRVAAILGTTVTQVTLGAGTAPYGSAFDTANNELYVTDSGNGDVTVLCGALAPATCGGTAMNAIVATIAVGATTPTSIAYASTVDYLFVCSSGNNNVYTINGATNAVLGGGGEPVGLGQKPTQVIYDSANELVYVVSSSGNQVSMFSGTVSGPAVTNYNSGGGSAPDSLVLDTLNGDVYVTYSGANEVAVFTGESELTTITLTGQTTPDSITLNTANGYLYVTNYGTPSVSVISTLLQENPISATPSGTPALTGTVGQAVTFWANLTALGTDAGLTTTSSAPADLGCAAAPTRTVANGLGTVTLACTPTVAGTYNLWINDTDNGGGATSSYASFNVVGAPSASAPSPSKASVDVGQVFTFSTTASGGNGIYTTYTWTQSSASLGCTLEDEPTITCSSTAAGVTYTVTATVTDSVGGVSPGSTSLDYTVYADPTLSIPTLTVNGTASTVADKGQMLVFTTALTGQGSGGEATYTWSGLPAGCSSTAISFTCVPTAAGSFSVNVSYTDSNGVTGTSGALALTVYADPTVPAPTANVGSADVGQSVAFYAAPTGGATPYTAYLWTGLPATGCTGTATSSPVCLLASGAVPSLTITVKVTDTSGWVTMSTGSLTFDVYADPALSTPTLTVNGTASIVADEGQTLVFTTTITSPGSGGITTYTWSGLPAPCAGTGASVSCTVTGTGSFSVNVSSTDSNGVTGTSGALALTIYADPTVPAPTANVGSADVGQSVTFYAAPTGGATPYTAYLWTGLPATGCTGTATSSTVCLLASGSVPSLTITVEVTDTSGWVTMSTGSLTFDVYADPALSTPTLTVNGTSSAIADIGQQLVFTTTITAPGSGGIATYTWSGLPAPCAGTGATVSCTVTGTGSFSVLVSVTDSNGFTTTGSPVSLLVNSDPSVPTPSSSVSVADVGQSVAFHVLPSGGSGPYVTFLWTGLPATGCTGSGTESPSCTLPASSIGTLSISVKVTDSAGWISRSTAPLSVTVHADPSASFTASRTLTDAGLPISFSGSGANGTPAYSYAWSFGDGNFSVLMDPTHAFGSQGSYLVTLWVNDSVGGSGIFQMTVNINAAVTVSASVSNSTLITGETTSFTATGHGGTSTISYFWEFGDGRTSMLKDPTHDYAQAGTYTATVWANDTIGGSQSSSVVVTVVQPTSVVATVSATHIVLGSAVALGCLPSGGMAPYTYFWEFGDGNTSTAQDPSHTYSTLGTYTARCWANNSLGSANAAVNITADAIVTFSISPGYGGALLLNGTAYRDGSSAVVAGGTYSLGEYSTPGWIFTTFSFGGGATGSGLTVIITGNGWVNATFALYPTVTFSVSPASCGPITFEGKSFASGSSGSFTASAGPFPVAAPSCNGYTFETWASTNGVSVDVAGLANTSVSLSGNGSLTAKYLPTFYPVELTTNPASCGTAAVGGVLLANGDSVNLSIGSYNLSVSRCDGYLLGSIKGSGGVSVNSAGSLVTVSGPGGITLTWVALAIVSLETPSSGCGFITLNGTEYGGGAVLSLAPGTYSVHATPCENYTLVSLVGTGGVSVTGASVAISGNGDLIANFTPVVVKTQPPTITPTAVPEWATGLILVLLVIALLLLVLLLLTRRKQKAPPAGVDQQADGGAEPPPTLDESASSIAPPQSQTPPTEAVAQSMPVSAAVSEPAPSSTPSTSDAAETPSEPKAEPEQEWDEESKHSASPPSSEQPKTEPSKTPEPTEERPKQGTADEGAIMATAIAGEKAKGVYSGWSNAGASASDTKAPGIATEKNSTVPTDSTATTAPGAASAAMNATPPLEPGAVRETAPRLVPAAAPQAEEEEGIDPEPARHLSKRERRELRRKQKENGTIAPDAVAATQPPEKSATDGPIMGGKSEDSAPAGGETGQPPPEPLHRKIKPEDEWNAESEVYDERTREELRERLRRSGLRVFSGPQTTETSDTKDQNEKSD